MYVLSINGNIELDLKGYLLVFFCFTARKTTS